MSSAYHHADLIKREKTQESAQSLVENGPEIHELINQKVSSLEVIIMSNFWRGKQLWLGLALCTLGKYRVVGNAEL